MKTIHAPMFAGTSRSLSTLMLNIADSGPRMNGVPYGVLMSGQPFYFDEFEAHRLGLIAGVGTGIFGKVGNRKSSIAKTAGITRKLLMMRGNRRRRRLVYDYKGEYGEVAKFCGTKLTDWANDDPKKRLKLNIFEPGVLTTAQSLQLLRNLNLAMGEPDITSIESEALSAALKRMSSDVGKLGVPSLPRLEDFLRNPLQIDAKELGLARADQLFDQGHRLAAMIRRVNTETLPGVFDGQTSDALRLDKCDSTFYNFHGLTNQAKRGLVSVVGGYVEFASGNGNPAFEIDDIFYEEAWEFFNYVGFAVGAQSGVKLHRGTGRNHTFVMHRLSDLNSAGEAGSQSRAIAKNLIGDLAVIMIFHVDSTQIDDFQRVFSLTDQERSLILGFKPGSFLMKFGDWSLVVHQKLSPFYEKELVYTNANMHRNLETDELPA